MNQPPASLPFLASIYSCFCIFAHIIHFSGVFSLLATQPSGSQHWLHVRITWDVVQTPDTQSTPRPLKSDSGSGTRHQRFQSLGKTENHRPSTSLPNVQYLLAQTLFLYEAFSGSTTTVSTALYLKKCRSSSHSTSQLDCQVPEKAVSRCCVSITVPYA